MNKETKIPFLTSLTNLSLTLCLVGVKIGRMENRGRKIGWKTVFFTVWQKKENGEEGIPGRKFFLLGLQFSSSQIRRKRLERKVLSQHFYTNALSFLTVTATQQRRRRQFSNHQLSTTQLSPPQPKNNSKSTQNNLKSTQN